MTELNFVPWTSTDSQWHVMDPKRSYVLLCSGTPDKPTIQFMSKLNVKDLVITAGDLDGDNQCLYPSEISELAINPNPSFKYLEIGPGFGEFTPELTEHKLDDIPVAIDLANYELMLEMLSYGLSRVRSDAQALRIRELQRRGETILDPTKVRFLNMGLEQALKENELNGEFDVVVDVMAATVYGVSNNMRDYREIINVEMRLIKEGGSVHTISGRYRANNLK